MGGQPPTPPASAKATINAVVEKENDAAKTGWQEQRERVLFAPGKGAAIRVLETQKAC